MYVCGNFIKKMKGNNFVLLATKGVQFDDYLIRAP